MEQTHVGTSNKIPLPLKNALAPQTLEHHTQYAHLQHQYLRMLYWLAPRQQMIAVKQCPIT